MAVAYLFNFFNFVADIVHREMTAFDSYRRKGRDRMIHSIGNGVHHIRCEAIHYG